MRKACFMGLGYIGLPTAIVTAKSGIKVLGVDINTNIVAKTNSGKLHFVEAGMEELLQEVIQKENIPCFYNTGGKRCLSGCGAYTLQGQS